MKSFSRYVGNTEAILQRLIAGELQPWKRSTAPVLNGEPWDELRRVTNLESLRRNGAFFTSGRLARMAIQLPARLPSASVIGFDPACGTNAETASFSFAGRHEKSLKEENEITFLVACERKRAAESMM